MRVPVPNSYGTVMVAVSIFEHNDCNLPSGAPQSKGGQFGKKGECGPAVSGPGQSDLPYDPPLGRIVPRSALDILAETDAERRKNMEDADCTSIEKLGGGVNKTFKVKLLGGIEGVFKPVEGETPGLRNSIRNRQFTQAEREVSAYEVDRLLGFGLTPTTVFRRTPIDVEDADDPDPGEFDPDDDEPDPGADAYSHEDVAGQRPQLRGEYVGSVQNWVVRTVDTEDYDIPSDAGVSPDGIYEMAILDFVIGNTDRHAANYMMDSSGVRAIDNGLSFPSHHGELRSKFGSNIVKRRLTWSEDAQKALSKRLDLVLWEPWLKSKNNMNADEKVSFMTRVNIMKRALRTPNGVQALFSRLFPHGEFIDRVGMFNAEEDVNPSAAEVNRPLRLVPPRRRSVNPF